MQQVQNMTARIGPSAGSTLGEAMAETLRRFGLTRLFGVGGDYVANTIKALEPAIALRPSSNELHAGFSACADAEIRGIGGCLVTYTVGSLPCLTAAALAKTEGLPVVFLSGAPGAEETRHGPIHHMVHAPHAWTMDADAALRAFASLGLRAERLAPSPDPALLGPAARQFHALVAHAVTHREPVFVEVPRDLLEARVARPPAREPAPGAIAAPEAEALARGIAERLRHARRPVVFFGERIKCHPGLPGALQAFCERHGIPYASSLFAKGLLDEQGPLGLGAYNGVFSNAYARRYIEQEADYMLEVATSLLPQDTATAFASGTHVVGRFPNKTRLTSAEPGCEDVLAVFRALEQLELPRFEPQPPLKRFEAPSGANLAYDELVAALNHFQAREPRSLIYLPEIGNAFFMSFDLYTRGSELGRSWLSNPFYAAMGTSLPYARAVASEIRERGLSDVPVVITGDGGFNFQHSELVHFLREGLFAVVLYLRNDIFHLGKSGDSPIYQCSDPRLDVLALAAAYGGRGWRCDTTAALIGRLEEALAEREGVYLLEIPVSLREEDQTQVIRMLNLMIKARSGVSESARAWEAISGLE